MPSKQRILLIPNAKKMVYVQLKKTRRDDGRRLLGRKGPEPGQDQDPCGVHATYSSVPDYGFPFPRPPARCAESDPLAFRVRSSLQLSASRTFATLRRGISVAGSRTGGLRAREAGI